MHASGIILKDINKHFRLYKKCDPSYFYWYKTNEYHDYFFIDISLKENPIAWMIFAYFITKKIDDKCVEIKRSFYNSRIDSWFFDVTNFSIYFEELFKTYNCINCKLGDYINFLKYSKKETFTKCFVKVNNNYEECSIQTLNEIHKKTINYDNTYIKLCK